MVRALGFYVVALGSNPVLNFGLHLCPVNSQVVASCQLGFLIMLLRVGCQ